MKSPPSKKKSTVTALKKPDINDKLSLDEATKLIASRTGDAADDNRTAEDRVRKRIIRAVNDGTLLRETDKTFVLGYLIDWARKIWPNDFNDIPAYVCMSGETSIKSEGFASPTVRAPTLKVCQERFDAAQLRIYELEKEIAGLRPDAEKWREYYFKVTRKRK